MTFFSGYVAHQESSQLRQFHAVLFAFAQSITGLPPTEQGSIQNQMDLLNPPRSL